MPYDLERRDAVCTKCAVWKRPTRAYMALLKSQDRPYICQKCRESAPAPAFKLGSLGYLN
jgi:hypothetical protein